MNLSPHFSLAEFVVTNTGLANDPSPAEVALLRSLAQFMEKVRHALGDRAITVHSAFRSETVNRAVGGVPNSAHRMSFACDFVCPNYGSPLQVAEHLDEVERAGTIRFDQLIFEGGAQQDGGLWVHVSRDPRLRGQRLTLLADGSYANGVFQP